MRSRLNSLLVVLGVVVVSTMAISAALDVRQLLPQILEGTGEWRQRVSWRQIASLDSAAAAWPAAAQPASAEDSVGPASAAASLPATGKEARSGSPLPADGVPAEARKEMLHGEEPFLPAVTPEPAAPDTPSRLVIPAIDLDAPILPAKISLQKVRGEEFEMWQAPNKFAAGWHEDSALLGQPGNTVMSGHHNIHGKVFERLLDLKPGDLIVVYGTQRAFIYQVTNTMILPEKYQELDVRMENARWILPSDDERLTLVTCWPAESNTHRLVIVAKPLGGQ